MLISDIKCKIINLILIKKNYFIAVDDASGRYTAGYFWGNNYWTGSMALCHNIFKIEEENFTPKKEFANTGLTFINGNSASAQLNHDNPPFVPRFGIVKVVFSETQTTPSVSTSHFY